MTHFLALAHKRAPRGRHRVHRMAAIVVKGGAVISTGVNLGTNDRRQHAEARAIRPHRDYRGAKIYVARENGGISKPCPACMEKIRAAGIVEISYVDRDRNPVTERV